MTPSRNAFNQHNDHCQVFKHLLEIPNFRQKYTKMLNFSKKFQTTKATAHFLKQCIENDVIPKTFRIKNEPLLHSSNRHKTIWTSSAKMASNKWMNSSILELEKKASDIRKCFFDLKEKLLEIIPHCSKNIFENMLIQKELQHESYSSKQKTKKLEFLLFQKNSQQPKSHLNIPSRNASSSLDIDLLNTHTLLCTPPSNPPGPPTPLTNPSLTPAPPTPLTIPQTPSTPPIAPHRNKHKNRPGKENRKKRKQFKRKRGQLSQKPLNVVFNYSKVELTEPMLKLLNRGLNFCIKPLNVNTTKLLCDFKKFERKCLWKEFFYNEEEKEYTEPIFKKEKTNIPKNHATPRPLQIFLNSVENNLQDKSLWNKALLDPKRSNISKEEFKALQNLIKLQKDRVITIKPADKGAGIIICNFSDYVETCESHLNATQAQPNGPPLPYYQHTSQEHLNATIKHISRIVKEGKENDYITENEAQAMTPNECKPSRFYMLYKVHKPHTVGSLPPGRPIISTSGSCTENIAKYLDHQVKHLVPSIPSYLQDTPHFLRILDEINKRKDLPQHAILVTIDVCALYTNIPIEAGISSFKAALENRTDKSVPTNFLVELLTIILRNNIFEFNKSLYVQNIGTAMGPSVAPSYANIFMAPIDELIKGLAKDLERDVDPVYLYKRFLDDIFLIWTGSPNTLFSFLEKLNEIHPALKFTYTISSPFECTITLPHDCFCHNTSSIPFLDTQVSLKEGNLVTDLYRKETDRCQYLLPSSCHPRHITRNIPYSLAYRLVRICSEKETLFKRFEELKEFLLSRNYHTSVIDPAITRASLIPRSEALKKVEPISNNKVVFAVDYHPALPSLTNILKSSWSLMIKDQYLRKIFAHPPMVAYRRTPRTSLRELLVQARLPAQPKRNPTRNNLGMKKCHKHACIVCPFIEEGRIANSSSTAYSVKIKVPVNCETKNVIYLITCQKPNCKKIQYIGETKRKFRDRFKQHISYIQNNQVDQPIGKHFNLPGHNLNDLKVQIIEKCKSSSDMYRKVKESEYIEKFNSKHAGLNKRL